MKKVGLVVMEVCECCKNECSKLVRHHWYEKDTPNIRREKLICIKCNFIFSTHTRIDNHILPSWELQIQGYNQYLISNKRPFVYHVPETVTKNFRLPKSLVERIKVLAEKQHWSLNRWVNITLEREANKKRGVK